MSNHIKNIIGDLPIYWINLERSKDRLHAIESIFKENYLTNYRIQGIDGNNLDFEKIKSEYKIDDNMNIYEVGCALSHLKAIETAYKNNELVAIIMEDDCSFEYLKYKTMSLSELMKVNNNWDIIQLSMITPRKRFEEYANKRRPLFLGYHAGAQAYIINYNGMKKILEYVEKNKQLNVSEKLILGNSVTYSTKPYFTYYHYKQVGSMIRENTKSAFATQSISKQLWDNYYINNATNNIASDSNAN